MFCDFIIVFMLSFNKINEFSFSAYLNSLEQMARLRSIKKQITSCRHIKMFSINNKVSAPYWFEYCWASLELLFDIQQILMHWPEETLWRQLNGEKAIMLNFFLIFLLFFYNFRLLKVSCSVIISRKGWTKKKPMSSWIIFLKMIRFGKNGRQ